MHLCCSYKRMQLFALLVLASTIVAVLIILFFFNYPTFAKQRIIDAVVIKNGTEAMDRFHTTKELKNLRLSFYLYNVTNANEVINSGAKFDLKEIGPFVYSEYKVKDFVDNNQTSGLITHKLRRRYIFDKSLSIGDPNKTLITWPNVPLLVARTFLDKLSFIERIGAYLTLNNLIKSKKEPAFITDTVENFIFGGSKREFFEYLQSLDKFKLINPWPLKDNMFALLYKRNNTWNPKIDYELTTSAGFGLNQTYRNLNQYIYVNGSRTLPYWRQQPPQCNIVHGTDGQFFSPFLNTSQNIEVYSIDLCRRLSMKFRQNVYSHGIPVAKYSLDERCLQSGLKNPENQCYCLARTSNGVPKPECQLDGLIDLSTCNTPNIVGSGAHFMASSPELVTRVNGLTPPNASLHEPVIYVEPNTGFAVKVRVPIQMNIRIEKGGLSLFNFFTDNKTLFLPLLWLDESAELTDDQASLLRSKLLLLDSWFVSMVLGGAIVLILAILVIATIICVKFKDNSRAVAAEPTETDPLISSPSSEERFSATRNMGATD